MEQIDCSEEQQIMQVYASFGLAMYQAQCLERELAMSLATVYGPGPSRISRAAFDELLESNFRQILGRLVKRFKEVASVSEDFEKSLEEALAKRNQLAHNYFWDRAGEFMTSKGRELMIRELQNVADFFGSIEQELAVIDRAWATAHGITEEIRKSALEDLIRNSEPR